MLKQPEPDMNRRYPRSSCSLPLMWILTSLACPTQAAEASADLMCDQLGREIALRAAEQLGAAINTANRAELAEIARQACLDYRTMPVVDVQPIQQAPAGPAAEDSGEGLFDLEVIDPEDRVRRAGLKRR
jgi:hypothetical protein